MEADTELEVEFEDIIGIDTGNAVKVSSKTGMGVDELLEALVRIIPPPEGDPKGPLQESRWSITGCLSRYATSHCYS